MSGSRWGTALVVVDLQRDFVDPAGHCAKSMDVSHIGSVVPANAQLISLARRHGIPVIYTLVTQHPKGAYASPRWIADNLRYPNFEPIHCIEGTLGVGAPRRRRADSPATSCCASTAVPRSSAPISSSCSAHCTSRHSSCRASPPPAVSNRPCETQSSTTSSSIVPAECIGDATPELVQSAWATFERILLPDDLTDLARLRRHPRGVNAGPRRSLSAVAFTTISHHLSAEIGSVLTTRS